MNILSKQWLVPIALVLLCVVPVLAGMVRMGQLVSGVITPENARFFAAPLPVIVHVISVTLFCVIGAFQFVPSLRVKNKWHRTSGRLLLPFGFASALTGLWMNQFSILPANDGTILYIERLVFGIGMLAALALGLMAVRRHDYTTHRNWMMRGYAIGMGAGTQVLTNVPWFMLVGTPGVNTRAVLMGAGWVINVVMVEWIIMRGNIRPALQTPA